MKRTEKSEYEKGKESGTECAKNPTNPLNQQSYWKAVKCCRAQDKNEPLILAYWKGFLEGWVCNTPVLP